MAKVTHTAEANPSAESHSLIQAPGPVLGAGHVEVNRADTAPPTVLIKTC